MTKYLQKPSTIRSFNITLIVRILDSLSKHDSLKITSLAMISSLNYSRCKQYLNLMNALNWIIFEKDDVGNLKIKSTVSGIKVMNELIKFIAKS